MRLNADLLGAMTKDCYAHVMLIEGNDDRGIDVGLVSTEDYPIVGIASHVDNSDAKGFVVATPQGERLLVMANHLKSKGYGAKNDSNELGAVRPDASARSTKSAEPTAKPALPSSVTFDDTPDSAPLAPLVGSGSNLKDISSHSKFNNGGFVGTYGSGGPSNCYLWIDGS